MLNHSLLSKIPTLVVSLLSIESGINLCPKTVKIILANLTSLRTKLLTERRNGMIDNDWNLKELVNTLTQI